MNPKQEQVKTDQMNTQAAAAGNIMMMGQMINMMPDSNPQKQILQQMVMQLTAQEAST